MPFPITFAGLAGPIPLSQLDTNFTYVSTTFMPRAGGTFIGAVSFSLSTSFTDITAVTLEVSGASALSSVTVSGGFTAQAGFFPALRVVTAAGTVIASATDYTIVVKKTVGAATPVNLPAAPVTNQFYWIKDGKGDAAANNITVTPLGGFLIDGAASFVINVNFKAIAVQWDGATWNILSAA